MHGLILRLQNATRSPLSRVSTQTQAATSWAREPRDCSVKLQPAAWRQRQQRAGILGKTCLQNNGKEDPLENPQMLLTWAMPLRQENQSADLPIRSPSLSDFFHLSSGSQAEGATRLVSPLPLAGNTVPRPTCKISIPLRTLPGSLHPRHRDPADRQHPESLTHPSYTPPGHPVSQEVNLLCLLVHGLFCSSLLPSLPSQQEPRIRFL